LRNVANFIKNIGLNGIPFNFIRIINKFMHPFDSTVMNDERNQLQILTFYQIY
jgi:hypothetical protein